MAHTHKLVDGVRVALTADEITQLNANDTTWKNDSLNRALEKLRKERTIKLSETDYLALSDNTMTSQMKTYRQQLRDLPSNYTTSDSSALSEDLSNLVWPTKP